MRVEVVVVIAEEAAVEVDASGEGGKATRELCTAGGVAKEAVSVGEVVEAVS